MTGFSADIVWLLLRSSVFLCFAFVFVWYILNWTKPRSVKIHRFAWSLVLLQGLILSPFAVQLPWLPSMETPRAHWLGNVGHISAPLQSIPDQSTEHESKTPNFTELPGAATESSVTATINVIDRGSISKVLFSIWLAGIGGCATLVVLRYVGLIRTLACTENPLPEWNDEWTELRSQQTSRSVPLRVHETLGPMLCLTPTGYRVIVPRDLWRSLSSTERIAVLKHELAHYSRGDIWKSLLARLVAMPHWFNPVAWIAVRRFDEVAEWACDEWLAESDPHQVPGYARVLLQLVEMESPQLGFASAGGASLAQRIRRLLTKPHAQETLFARVSLWSVLAVLVVFGTFRWELVATSAVAQDTQTEQTDDPEESFRQQLVAFADQIDSNGDELVLKLKERIKSDTGQLVARDRIGWVEERLRNQARDQAIPEFMKKHFNSDGSIRDSEFAKAYLETCSTYNDDISEIREIMRGIASKVAGDSEENKLLKRFLVHDAAAPMLYFGRLRSQLRPGVAEIQERLDEVFVQVGDTFQIRSGHRDKAEEVLGMVTLVMKSHDLVKEELAEFGKELAESDDRTKRLKRALQDPAFHAIASFRMARESDGNLTDRLNELFEHLEWVTIDAADGLVVNDEAAEEVDELLYEAERISAAAKKLRAPVAAFAMRVAEQDELHVGLKQFLESDIAPMLVAEDYEVSSATPEKAVRAMLAEGLETSGDGIVRLRDEVKGEFTELARETLREYRTLKRKTRPIDRFADHVQNEALMVVLKSDAGKLVIADAIKSEFAGRRFDGLAVWIDEHFDHTPNGYVFKGDYEPEVREFLQQIDEVEQELANDDF